MWHKIIGSIALLCYSLTLYGQGGREGYVYKYSYPGTGQPADSNAIQLLISQVNEHIQVSDSAITLLWNLLQQSKEISFHTGAVQALLQLSDIQYKNGNFQSSLECAIHSIDIAKQYSHCHRFLSSGYVAAGKAHNRLGNTSEAARCYYQALATKEKYPESDISPGKIYLQLSTLPLGEHLQNVLLLKAERYARQHKDYVNLGIILMNKANTYNKRKLYNESQRLLNEALALGIAAKDTLLQYQSLVQAASTLLYQEKTDSALACILKAKEISPSGDKNDKGHTYYAEYLTGEIYLKMKQYDRAEAFIQEALEAARHMQLKYLEELCSSALAYIFHQTGRYREAYEYERRYHELKDSSLNQRIAADINQMEVRYRSVEKDKRLAQNKVLMMQQEQAINQRNLWIGIIVAVVLLSGLLLAIIWRNKRKLEAQSIKSQRLQALMDGEEQERSRMAKELHDGIGGILTGIKMNITALQGKQEMGELKAGLEHVIAQMTTMGAEIHRTAYNMMPELLDRHGLQQALTMYCQQLEATKKLQIDIQFLAKSAVIPGKFAVPLFRITQELLQNIIKHARAGKATIQVQTASGRLFLSVEDDGAGFDIHHYKKGLGLENIRSRVAALNGTCTVESEPGKGTLVFIDLALDDE